jgi:hypothetical protein
MTSENKTYQGFPIPTVKEYFKCKYCHNYISLEDPSKLKPNVSLKQRNKKDLEL